MASKSATVKCEIFVADFFSHLLNIKHAHYYEYVKTNCQCKTPVLISNPFAAITTTRFLNAT